MLNGDPNNFAFRDILAEIVQDKKGRPIYDEQGNFIAADDRRGNFRKNPYGVNPGNAINPNVTFADEILGKSNQTYEQLMGNKPRVNLFGGQQ